MFEISYGLTDKASCMVSPAPAKGDKIKTPGHFVRQATNSFATKFIPSLIGVTKATSESLRNIMCLTYEIFYN